MFFRHPALCLAKISSRQERTWFDNLEDNLGEVFRFGSGRSVTSDSLEHCASRLRKIGGHTSPSVRIQI